MPPTDQHAAYVALLARWNKRLNLTSLHIDPPDAAALERLIGEPIRASALISPADTFAVDLGSGGGSPALPLKIACPWLRLVLVESKARKCAFLREAVRHLKLQDVMVENRRFEDLSATVPGLAGRADVVTFRAVRADDQLWAVVRWLLSESGRVLWFGGESTTLPAGFRVADQTGATLCLEPSRSV